MEANIHQFWLYDVEDYVSELKMAPNMGGFLEFELNEMFAIQPEVQFFVRRSGVRQGGRKDDFRQWGIILPVCFVGREYIDRGTWYFGLGAYAGVGLNAYLENAKTSLYNVREGKRAVMNRWDYGLSGMMGYEYDHGFQLNMGLHLGLKNQLDAGRKEATVINKVITVGMGYHF
jgi:hypothetical protein